MAWGKGISGNPTGRPKGARNRVTVACEKLLQSDAETILRTVLDAAKLGDMSSARWVLERVIPAVKERPVRIELPEITAAADIADAFAAVLTAVAAGELLPSEAVAVTGMLEQRRRALETAELEKRIAALEGAA